MNFIKYDLLKTSNTTKVYFGDVNVMVKVIKIQKMIYPEFFDKKWYFITKIVRTYCEKKLFCDREKLLKFDA